MPKHNVREQLLSASFDTLYCKGYNATSVQDITEAAGVPKGSFYNHFASKEALGAEIVAIYAQLGKNGRAVLADTTATPRERLRRYLAGLVEAGCTDDSNRGCMLGNFSAELSLQSPLIRSRIEDALANWSEDIAAVITEAQGLGDVADDMPADALAAFIVDSWQGAVLRSKATLSNAPLELFLTMIVDKILR